MMVFFCLVSKREGLAWDLIETQLIHFLGDSIVDYMDFFDKLVVSDRFPVSRLR